VMSPVSRNDTPPTRTSSTIESSLRTLGRSQSGSEGLRTVTVAPPVTRSPPVGCFVFPLSCG
jgi:hypothetical protein